jgi:uncharacterized protein YbbC (DUF1343 family)
MSKFACIALFFSFVYCNISFAQQSKSADHRIITGAERTNTYLPFLQNKKVAVFANQTSVIGNTHLIDSLLALKVNVVKIFGPEHGFRGKADAGEHVANGSDIKTGLPVISLYGDHKKPTPADLNDVDILIYDIQDVGVRFYTFISSLQLFLEAALENDKELIILDRPNPNGFYVDGPVLAPACKSFVGMQPIPIVHGMTVCEYALMLMSERWLSENANKKLNELNIAWNEVIPPIKNVDTYFGDSHLITSTDESLQKKLRFSANMILCINYTHDMQYHLPVNPSPNLREMQSIYWYPSTCLFEGTVISEGRGTPKPFQIFGHPLLPKNLYAFTPQPNEGAKSSKCYNQVCYGWNVSGSVEEVLQRTDHKIQLQYLLEAYKLFPDKDSFFLKTNFFNKLAGNEQLMQQIKAGTSEVEIRKSWEPALDNFKNIRKKYLLYPDFK